MDYKEIARPTTVAALMLSIVELEFTKHASEILAQKNIIIYLVRYHNHYLISSPHAACAPRHIKN